MRKIRRGRKMCGSFIARIVLKVSKSQKQILKFSFEPKKERLSTKICFRDLLTFILAFEVQPDFFMILLIHVINDHRAVDSLPKEVVKLHIYNSILFFSLLVLLSNLDLCGFYFFGCPHINSVNPGMPVHPYKLP